MTHLAVDLRSETPSRNRIRSAVRKALTDPVIRDAVARIRVELAGYDAFALIDADIETDAAARALSR